MPHLTQDIKQLNFKADKGEPVSVLRLFRLCAYVRNDRGEVGFISKFQLTDHAKTTEAINRISHTV